MTKRYLVACGGTGGHFYPGFALGKALQEQGNTVLFVVRKDDPAAQLLAQNNLNYTQLDLSAGLPRTLNPVRHARFVWQLQKSLRQTRWLLKTFYPNVVLGMGGYVSFPLVFCAHYMGIQTAVHESNAIWGLANKICARFADLPLMGLPIKNTFKKAVLVSTPIRPEFALPVNREEVLSELGLNPALPTALIMGGSQGAKGLNEALPNVIKNAPQWQFIHLTGKRWYEPQVAAYQGFTNVKTLAYSEEIYKLMKSADLMICRSGASTLAEIIACQLPAIFVPFPYAAANHQYYNAKVLADKGCGKIVLESPRLAQELTQALQACTPQVLTQMREAYTQLQLPSPLEATVQITKLIENL